MTKYHRDIVMIYMCNNQAANNACLYSYSFRIFLTSSGATLP